MRKSTGSCFGPENHRRSQELEPHVDGWRYVYGSFFFDFLKVDEDVSFSLKFKMEEVWRF